MPIPKLLVTAALTVANMALTMTRKIEGPRLDDLKFTGGDYGAPLVWMRGKRRIECPIFWAENLSEVKRRRKTKGGKYNEYTYYGTWAVALAGHEIGGVLRIWFDTHLVYDLTSGGPVTPFDFGGEGTISDHIAVYLGPADQSADPRMLATVEDLHGEGSCPAYRDTAYIVFKDIPLEKLGNRIPQVSVEFVSAGAPAYPWESKDVATFSPHRLQNFTYSADYARFMWTGSMAFEIWDTATRTLLHSGNLPKSIKQGARIGLLEDGRFYAVSTQDADAIYLFSADGASYSTVVTYPSFSYKQQEVVVCKDGNGVEHWATKPWSTLRKFYFDGAAFEMEDLTGIDWAPAGWFTDAYGDVWVVGRAPGTDKRVAYFYRMVYVSGRGGTGFFTATGLQGTSDNIPEIQATHFTGSGADQFVIEWEHRALYAIEVDTGTVLHSRTGLGLDVYATDTVFANLPPGSSTIWLDDQEISLADLTTVRTVDLTDWKAEVASSVIYDPINHALLSGIVGADNITWRFLDRSDAGAVTLGDICAAVADEVGVADYDFTDLDQAVPGWSVTHGQATNAIEPLLDVYDSDIRPHDFELEGIKRTGAASGSIAVGDFAGRPRYSVKLRQAAELPRAVIVDFADTDADQQPNATRSDRPLATSEARGEQVLDMTTLAMDVDTARGLADRYFRRIWNARREVDNVLTAQQLALEPGDVVTLGLDGESDAYRLRRLLLRADDTLDAEWVYDHPSLALTASAGGAGFDGRGTTGIVIGVLSKGFVLDIPLISDNDNAANPVAYLAAGPETEGTWPGATAFQRIDGEYSEPLGTISGTDAATWGYATDTLADANPWLWDRGNSVNIALQNGSLAGASEALVNAVPATNRALLGAPGRWEVINFATATLEGDGSYTLTGLKRGRRGTEWATGLHAEGDTFLLLDNARAEELGLSEVGTNLSFKVITDGRTEAGALPIDLEPFSGASLKPYAPSHMKAIKQANGDFVLSWVRRTRVGGAWTSETTIPLSENSESYDLEILDGADVVWTVYGLSDPEYTYTAARQTADFGSEQSSLSWRVYQNSDAVGRGFAAAA